MIGKTKQNKTKKINQKEQQNGEKDAMDRKALLYKIDYALEQLLKLFLDRHFLVF